MYCTCCGKQIMDGCNFCPECGVKLNMNAKRGSDFIPLGTYISVPLITGEVKGLYYYNGLFYKDKFCTNPFPIGLIPIPYRNPLTVFPFLFGLGYLHFHEKK